MPVPSVENINSENSFFRVMKFKSKGDTELGHRHTFSHYTVLLEGSLSVEVHNTTTNYKAPCMIFIDKDEFHILKSLEDNTVAVCVHITSYRPLVCERNLKDTNVEPNTVKLNKE